MRERPSHSSAPDEELLPAAGADDDPADAPSDGGTSGNAFSSDDESTPSEVEAAPRRDRSRIAVAAAAFALVAVGVGLILTSPSRGRASPPALALTNADVAGADGGDGRAPEPAAVLAVTTPVVNTPRPPPAWRVASLKGETGVEVAEGTFGKLGFVQSLTNAGVPRPEIKRLASAFDGVHRLDRPAATDAFVVARERTKNTVVAFEYATSPTDVWQARVEDGPDGRIIAKKLDLFVDHKRVASGLVVSADLAKTISSAGLRPEIALAVDDALEGHIEPGTLRAGARLRVAATEDWVDNVFARVKVDAIELVPKNGSPIRVYFYERDSTVDGSPRRAPAAGFYDAKGKQPYRGAFRSPLALARVTSRFNPRRLHPVLKTVMPHQGVDFGATTGTPVYASSAGTVIVAGNGGPCGNMVEIEHGGGLTTVYCHLKGFAQGLHSGQKVEPRQLVGYVGQTGRVTGPHLHFGVKKNGVFVDPLSLKMDGVRVIPPADRDAFAKKRSDLDAVLDGVALPSAVDIPDETNEDKDLHGE